MLIHFVNADLIAGGISPLRPELAAIAVNRRADADGRPGMGHLHHASSVPPLMVPTARTAIWTYSSILRRAQH